MHAGTVIGLPDSTGIYLPPRGIGSVGEQEPSVAAHRRLKTATGGALGVIQLDDDPSKLEPSWVCVGSKITTLVPLTAARSILPMNSNRGDRTPRV